MSVAQSVSGLSASSASASPLRPPAAPLSPTAAKSPSVYPFPCPSWCRLPHDLEAAALLGTLTHMSAEFTVPNPSPLNDGPAVMLRAQLFGTDRPEGLGRRACIWAGRRMWNWTRRRRSCS